MKLRYYILLLLLWFGLAPLLLALLINLPLILDRTAMFYQKAYLQNLRADFRDLDQHLASRDEMIRLLAKLPEPGIILGDAGSEDAIDLARARYTGWINQMLGDQSDLIEILFVDAYGDERFWLHRDPQSLQWRPTADPPKPPGRGFINAGSKLKPGEVIVSRIRIDPYAASADPRQLMTLQLASPVGEQPDQPGRPLGLLLVTIDVGGLAQFYRDTLWVNNDGGFLRPGEPIGREPSAFQEFPGLEQIFAEGKLGLWKGEDRPPLLWVPMFLTEEGVPLWVGRTVDPSPIEEFRDALIVRVLSIVLALILVVLLMARWLAARAERFGQELQRGIRGILRDGRTQAFTWRGPQEVRELGQQLTELAHTHAEHLAIERRHTRQLEQSNRYKSEFLANVSHELRTPLNSILLLSKLLAAKESGLDPDQRRQAEVIHEAGRDLRTMIDNVLDISRIEAGAVTVSLEWVDLASMLDELRAMLAPIFTDKGLTFTLRYAPQAPTRIYSDRDKLRQIVKNFLSNAAKFTEHGGAVLEVASGDVDLPVAIAVCDTGIGIPPGKEGIIFDAFQQADGSTRRRYGGTGLGLSISRELAQLLGGRIDVSSTPGHGSCFTLRLPLLRYPADLAAVEIIEAHDAAVVSRAPSRTLNHTPSHHGPPPAPATGRPPPHDLTASADSEPSQPTNRPHRQPTNWSVGDGDQWVLLVERDVQGLVTATALLEGLGLRVQTAANGEEAIETLAEEDDCALLLLAAAGDPNESCDTIRRVRDDLRYTRLPIVLIGMTDATQRQRCADAGVCCFLDKPITPAALTQRVQSALASAAPTAAGNKLGTTA